MANESVSPLLHVAREEVTKDVEMTDVLFHLSIY